jgi:dUTP pyrophosphatase
MPKVSKYGKGRVVILRDKTILHMKYDPSLLSEGSHSRIYVQCTRCNEIFQRENRHLGKLHACPTHKSLGGIDYKWCDVCTTFVPLTEFHKNAARIDGCAPYCKKCEKIKYWAKDLNKKKAKLKTLNGWINWSCIRKRGECRKHGIPCDLTYEILLDKWYYQRGRCFYSNVPMEFNTRSLKSATLERLDSSVGYVATNIVWASKAMNYMKNDASYGEFKEFLADMGIHSMPRCEYKPLSADAVVPCRAKPFDAGMDIYAINDIVLVPKEFTEIKTGVAMSAPDGYYFTIEGRSSLFKHGVEPVRGIIDASYTGEITVVLFNVSSMPYPIKKGERVAQLIMHKVYRPDIVVVDDFSIDHRNRGNAGYGSTGK